MIWGWHSKEPEDDLGGPILTLEVEIKEIGFEWRGNSVEIKINLIAYTGVLTIYPVAYVDVFFDEEVFSESARNKIMQQLSSRYIVGSCYRLTTHRFSIYEEQLNILNPTMEPLNVYYSEKLRKLLREPDRTFWVDHRPSRPRQMMPEALLSIVQNLLSMSCGKTLNETDFHCVMNSLMTDSLRWYNVRVEDQNHGVKFLLYTALDRLSSISIPIEGLEELLVHIDAPLCAEIPCFTGVDELIREIVGEKTRIIYSTSLSLGANCVISLLGR